MISAIFILVVIGGLGVAYVLYMLNQDSVESNTQNIVLLYRLLWIPALLLFMYSVFQYGGIAGYSLMFITAFVFGILFLVYRPDQDVKQLRRQS